MKADKQKNCNHATCQDECRRPQKPKAKKPIKKRGNKMKALMKQYLKQKNDFFTLHQICEVADCLNPSQDIHHKKGRIGKLLLDETYWMAVCRSCHTRIETSPDWAKENNYSLSRLNKRA